MCIRKSIFYTSLKIQPFGSQKKMSSIVTASEEITTSIVAAWEETTNTRLARLLINRGTQVLREYLNSLHPPTTLQTVLTSKVGWLQANIIIFDRLCLDNYRANNRWLLFQWYLHGVYRYYKIISVFSHELYVGIFKAFVKLTQP